MHPLESFFFYKYNSTSPKFTDCPSSILHFLWSHFLKITKNFDKKTLIEFGKIIQNDYYCERWNHFELLPNSINVFLSKFLEFGKIIQNDYYCERWNHFQTERNFYQVKMSNILRTRPGAVRWEKSVPVFISKFDGSGLISIPYMGIYTLIQRFLNSSCARFFTKNMRLKFGQNLKKN